MRTRMIENPPWVVRAIAQSFHELRDAVDPDWQPLLEHPRATRRGELVVEIPEYGCGAYGCVMPTNDPGIAFKITTDSTEAEFVSELIPKLGNPPPDGFVRYEKVMKLKGKHEGRPLFAIWREEAEDVGELMEVSSIPRADRKRTAELIWHQKASASEAYRMLRDHPRAYIEALALRSNALTKIAQVSRELERDDAPWETFAEERPVSTALALLLAYHEANCNALARDKVMPAVGEALLVCLAHGIMVADVHEGNVGRVTRDGQKLWVITDPGNVAVLPRPWGSGPQRALPAEVMTNPSTDASERDDIHAFLTRMVPAAVKYMVYICRTAKACGQISELVARCADSAGLDCYVVSVPGHFYNVFALDDGSGLEIDLTHLQFSLPYGSPRDTDEPEEREVIYAAFRRALANPWDVITFKRITPRELEKILPRAHVADDSGHPSAGPKTLEEVERIVARAEVAENPPGHRDAFRAAFDRAYDLVHPHANPGGDFASDLSAAFDRLDAASGRHNYVLIPDLRAALPQYTPAQFNAGLRDLRRAMLYSADTADGRHVRLTEEQRAGGLQEAGENLMYLARRTHRNPPWKSGEDDVPVDPELLAAMEADPREYRRAADKFLAAAAEIAAAGGGFGGSRKVFISDVLEAIGAKKSRMAMSIVCWQALGWVMLARADLVGAMDAAKVKASAIHSMGDDFNFVIVPVAPVRRNPLPGQITTYIDPEILDAMRASPEVYKRAADKFRTVAEELAAAGRGFGPRKVFLADVCEELGTTTKRMADTLVCWNNLSWIQLARADLVGAMDPAKVKASAIHMDGADFNFIVIEPPQQQRPRRR